MISFAAYINFRVFAVFRGFAVLWEVSPRQANMHIQNESTQLPQSAAPHSPAEAGSW
jgi:hypothetical protein